MSHPVLQFQIISSNPEQSARFYSDLFQWRIDANNPLGYRRIDTGSAQGIQSGIWPAPPQAPAFTQILIGVEDVPAAAQRAVELGAKLLVPPSKLPEGDEMAVLHDPLGMSFALWRRP